MTIKEQSLSAFVKSASHLCSYFKTYHPDTLNGAMANDNLGYALGILSFHLEKALEGGPKNIKQLAGNISLRKSAERVRNLIAKLPEDIIIEREKWSHL